MFTAKKIAFISLIVALLKTVLYFLDAQPGFFLGDSASYLATATVKWFPPDRSYLYGYFIRWLCVRHFHSLQALVVFQTALGGFTCIILAWCLLNFFQASFPIALGAALLFALEPLEWLSEHYVLTEAFAGFLLALFMWAIFSYIRSGRAWKLLLLGPLTFAIVSIRLSNLPVILTFSVLVPALGWLSRWRTASVIRCCTHLAISIVAVQLALLGFRHFNAVEGHRPPALSYANGFFLAGDFAPIIRPEDFPDDATRTRIFTSLKFPLNDRAMRPVQRWMTGGLIPTIVDDTPDRTGYADQYVANHLCELTAMHAVRRDPLGLVKLSLLTFGDYWRAKQTRDSVIENMGLAYDFPAEFIGTLKLFQFQYRAEDYQRTLSKQYAVTLLPWYFFLLLSPVVFLLSFPIISRANWPSWFLLSTASLIFVVVACTFVEKPTVRYLQPIGWLVVTGMGIIAQSLQMRLMKTNTKVIS